MKGHRQGPSGVDQRRHTVLVRLTPGRCPWVRELPGNNALRASLLRFANLIEHCVMLGVRTSEVPGAWAHEDKNCNGELGPTRPDDLHIGCRTTMGEIRRQLEAVGATLGGRERSVQRLDRRLDENGHSNTN